MSREVLRRAAVPRHGSAERISGEFRSLEKVELQRFRDYRAVFKDKLRTKLDATAKPRPAYPADEAYRNSKSKLHYGEGDLLVLVDAAVYDAVAASIDQYVLDVGREGYWATVYAVNGGAAQDVRDFIRSKRPVGALLVGAITVPWYDHQGDDFLATSTTWTRTARGP